MMDRKERKSGDPFGGAPMKQFEGPQLPAPPKIDEVVAEAEEVIEEQDLGEEEEQKCPCGFPQGLCIRYSGSVARILAHIIANPDEG